MASNQTKGIEGSGVRSEENTASRQLLINVTWAVGSVVGCVATILLLGWLRGSL